ncbi:MFS transporter [Paenibacillus helianthi]|uniref:MFS transporter n=1 Tax=Paenibacillus helianthi TaxID=1349432 RepID=A0ABX3EVI6_9BACL|nr:MULTISPECIES: MFS transporter [Paenibacillus]OKP89154.1 MFS transporter [Paenibacillus sp. P3E]OKP91019.1 MFS transporter [Paenibacillus helianthi]
MLEQGAVAKNKNENQERKWSLEIWGLLLIVSGALFLDGVDLSMVNIALPSIGNELHLSTGSLQWIVNAYILGYGGFLLLGGRVADLLGRRQVFLTAVAVFGLASIVSSFMSNEIALIGLRLLKGIAAGFTVPAGMSIVSTSFAAGPDRMRALSIYSIIGMTGFALGLVFGGLLTEIGWRFTLLAPGPVALILLLAGLKLVPHASRERVTMKQFDLWGSLTITASLLVLVYALVEAPAKGWTSITTILLIIASVVLLFAFILVERRHPQPLVRLGIFRSMSLVNANFAAMMLLGSFMSFQFIATLYLQDSLSWSPLWVALAFLPSSLFQVVFGPRIDRVMKRIGTPMAILIGLVLVSIAYLLFFRVDPALPYWNFLLPTMILIGIGFVFAFPGVNIQATHNVIPVEQGLASGLVNTSLQIGGAISLAVITAVLNSSHEPMESNQLLPNMYVAIAIVAGLALAGVLSSVIYLVQLHRANKKG